jgi:hypothetical protein
MPRSRRGRKAPDWHYSDKRRRPGVHGHRLVVAALVCILILLALRALCGAGVRASRLSQEGLRRVWVGQGGRQGKERHHCRPLIEPGHGHAWLRRPPCACLCS